ncbi:MAG: saccharopine dehydrogenase NADP-binding domain-containing protein [Rhodospirillaceae bacterium]|nr:saccharopine dehydrogenase NADP-binding domain-containing protein [Rhodospirillaceae bacterium]
MRVLILGGAGMMGSGTARDLLAPYSRPMDVVIVADGAADRLDALRTSLPDARLGTVHMDITDDTALAGLLADCDLCINAVPTYAGHQMRIFDACLAARRTYVDFGGMGVLTVQQKAKSAQWEAAGATAVLGLGADPGLSNVICRAVADRLDRIDRINLYWAATLEGPENPVLVPPYAISTVLAEYGNASKQFLDGRLQEVPARSGEEVIDLPAPWGPTRFMYSQHSEPLTVPFAHGIADKGIREFTWKLHLPEREHEAWLGLVKAGFGDFATPVTLRDGTTVSPLAVLEAVIDRNMKANAASIPQQDSHEIHFAVGHGLSGGRPTKVTCRVEGHPHPLYDGYVDAATSMNMSIAVQWILSHPKVPGVWGPEEYLDVEDYLADLNRRHFTVEVEVTTTETL